MDDKSLAQNKDYRTEFFRITFDRIGFTFASNPIGAKVAIEWNGKAIMGEVWASSYSPERGYYSIGVRHRDASNPIAQRRDDVDEGKQEKPKLERYGRYVVTDFKPAP